MSAQKRVFIIHGWEATPESNWFPWLKSELENRGFKATVPAMPDSERPILEKWLKYLDKLVGEVDSDTYFVGHSLGAITILRYLEALPSGQIAGGAVLVSGFPEAIGFNELASFFATPLAYGKVKNSVNKIIAINSDNDPYVPLRNGEIIRDKLGVELIVVNGGGHLNLDNGYAQMPIALEALLKITG